MKKFFMLLVIIGMTGVTKVSLAVKKHGLHDLIGQIHKQYHIDTDSLYDGSLSLKDVGVLRNTVYAIHGHSFQKQELTDYFSQFSWYNPEPAKKIQLTEVDRWNLEMIRYAEVELTIKQMIKTGQQRALSSREKKMVGLWQNGPMMASGWGHTYAFFEGGWVWERFNQMDCAKRLYGRVGTWEIIDNKLHLRFIKQAVIEGGKLIPATGSCGSDKELVGGIPRLKYMTEQVEHELGSMGSDPEMGHPMRKLGKTVYWQMNPDPWDY